MYCRLGAKLQSRKAEWKLQKRVTDISALKYIQAIHLFKRYGQKCCDSLITMSDQMLYCTSRIDLLQSSEHTKLTKGEKI